MDENETTSNKTPRKDEPAPTADFTGLAKGPGTQIGQFRTERELARSAIVTHWANGPLKIF